VQFYLAAHGEVNVDVPCVGREPIGRCWATNRKNPNISYFEIGVSPKLLPNGALVLQQQVLNVFVSLFDVDVVTAIPALLGYLNPYAGIWGFLVDKVLAREIEMKLPNKFQDAVPNIMGKVQLDGIQYLQL
jgi:hypothetical protein